MHKLADSGWLYMLTVLSWQRCLCGSPCLLLGSFLQHKVVHMQAVCPSIGFFLGWSLGTLMAALAVRWLVWGIVFQAWTLQPAEEACRAWLVERRCCSVPDDWCASCCAFAVCARLSLALCRVRYWHQPASPHFPCQVCCPSGMCHPLGPFQGRALLCQQHATLQHAARVLCQRYKPLVSSRLDNVLACVYRSAGQWTRRGPKTKSLVWVQMP